MIIRRAATIFEDYRIARQQAYFSSEKRTVSHPSNSNSNSNNNNNNNNNSTATIQEIDENGIIVKEKTISKKIMKKAQSGSSLPAVSQSQGSGVVEIIAQNEEMKAAFKRLGDMLSPYLTEDHADVSINIFLLRACTMLHVQLTAWKCMYRRKCRTISKPCGQNKSVT